MRNNTNDKKQNNLKTAPTSTLFTINKNQRQRKRYHSEIIQSIDFAGELSRETHIFIDNETTQKLQQQLVSHLEITDKNGRTFAAILGSTSNKLYIGNGLFTLNEAEEIINEFKGEFKLDAITPDDLKNHLNDKIIDLVTISQIRQDDLDKASKLKKLIEINSAIWYLSKALHILATYNSLRKKDFMPISSCAITIEEIRSILARNHNDCSANNEHNPPLTEREKLIRKTVFEKLELLEKQKENQLISNETLNTELNRLYTYYNNQILYSSARNLIYGILPRFSNLVCRVREQLPPRQERNTSQKIAKHILPEIIKLYAFLTNKTIENALQDVTHSKEICYKGKLLDFVYKILQHVHNKTGIIIGRKDAKNTIGERIVRNREFFIFTLSQLLRIT